MKVPKPNVKRLLKQLAEFDHLKPKPLPTMKFVASDVGPVAPPTIIPDSDPAAPIAPGYPTILDDQPATIVPPPAALQSTGRRTSLAQWITNPSNPLTARVMVNRLWQQHFGRGLVATTSDFGRLGTPPSHPELLDWLARRFVNDGWSLKKLHRLILTSATYRQTSERPLDGQLAELDPQNILLWRMNPRRLSAEEIHDCVLAASGELRQGKRAIYKTVKRNQLDPLLAAFDFPDRVQSECVRHRTTTSPQALMLMNDPWLHQRAQAMATQLGTAGLDALVASAYQKLYFRQPTKDELRQAIRFYESYHSITPEPEPPKRLAALPDGRPAISLLPDQGVSIRVPTTEDSSAEASDGDFTIEATVLLRSLYADASVRTIVADWSGNHAQSGWSLGVTSTKSAYQPRNLILQLVGARDQDKLEYEVVASDLRLELNTPYHVAVSVNLDDTSKQGIRFYVKNLTKPDSKPLTAAVAHLAKRNVRSGQPLEIGGRSKQHRWDGLIHRVQLHDAALEQETLFGDSGTQASAEQRAAHLLLDIQFASESELGHDASGYGRHAVITANDTVVSPSQRARIALLHAFLCSNEMIYVD